MIKDIKLELENIEPTRRKMFWFLVVLTIIAFIINWRVYEFRTNSFLISFWIFIIFFGVLFIKWQLLISLFRLWMIFSITLGWIILRILLIIVYVVLIVPMGIIFRVIGKDLLKRKLEPEARTYWIRRDEEIDRSRYLKKF